MVVLLGALKRNNVAIEDAVKPDTIRELAKRMTMYLVKQLKKYDCMSLFVCFMVDLP